MCAALPLAVFLLLATLWKRKAPRLLWREAFLLACLCTGLFILASTEFLSVFKAFAFGPLAGMWAGAAAVLAGFHIAAGRSAPLTVSFPARLSTLEKFLLLLLAVVVAVTGFLALAVPPNTWDAMTYHMARVAHWVQDRTVTFYPSHIDRQLFLNPFAEYWIAQLQVLANGRDFLANTVQWLSMLGVLTAVSLIMRALGGGRAGQLLCAALVATLPNAIVQASSTQNDFVAALWSTIAVYFILANVLEPKVLNGTAVAIAVLLAVYTKHSVLIIILPFLIWMVWRLWHASGARRGVLRRVLAGNAAMITVALAIAFGGVFLRNGMVLGSMILPGENAHMLPLNNVRDLASNVLLHLGMHGRLGLPAFDDPFGAVVEQVHQWMGTTVLTSGANHFKLPFNYQDFPFYEDEVPNFLFLLAFLAALVYALVRRTGEAAGLKTPFFAMSGFCFMLFNLVVKWSPFDGRYHLPYFVLLAPFVADWAMRWRPARTVLPVLLAINAVIFLGWNASKPLVRYAPTASTVFQIPRDVRYFYNQPGSTGAYMTTARTILASGCREVGLKIGSDTWEYPFWVYLRKDPAPLRLEHVLVGNTSGKLPYPLGSFQPCVILSNNAMPATQLNGRHYVPVPNPGGFYLLYSLEFLTEQGFVR